MHHLDQNLLRCMLKSTLYIRPIQAQSTASACSLTLQSRFNYLSYASSSNIKEYCLAAEIFFLNTLCPGIVKYLIENEQMIIISQIRFKMKEISLSRVIRIYQFLFLRRRKLKLDTAFKTLSPVSDAQVPVIIVGSVETAAVRANVEVIMLLDCSADSLLPACFPP